MACSKKILFILLISFSIIALFSTSCFANEWSQEEIDGVLNNLNSIQDTLTTVTDNLATINDNFLPLLDNISSQSNLSSERLQLILNNLKQLNVDMNAKFDKLQSASAEINKNLVYCLTNLQQIKALATEMSKKLDTLQAGLKEINTNVQYCLTNLQKLNEKIDKTNAYLDSIDSNVKDIRDAIVVTNEKIDKTNEKLDNVNNNITDNNVNADSSSLPSDNTQDITEDGFNSIFNQLYNTFTKGSAQDLVIVIPFTKKSFIINTKNVYGSADLGFVKTLIEMFWYFVISYFIVQDIAKKINKIKSGDIENVQQDNIKEDLL